MKIRSKKKKRRKAQREKRQEADVVQAGRQRGEQATGKTRGRLYPTGRDYRRGKGSGGHPTRCVYKSAAGRQRDNVAAGRKQQQFLLPERQSPRPILSPPCL